MKDLVSFVQTDKIKAGECTGFGKKKGEGIGVDTKPE